MQDSGWGRGGGRGGVWRTGNLTDTAIQTLTHSRFKIRSLKIDDEQHMTRVLSRKGNYLFFRSSELTKLTNRSFRDFPLRYDMRGDSLKISLSCYWFCIRCH